MKISYFSFDYVPIKIQDLWKEAFSKVVDEGIFVGGPFVSKFEETFARICETEYAIGLSNGFDGLELALRALDIGKGDRVAVPAHTFIATWNAVIAVGAQPVGVDVGSDAQISCDQLKSILDRNNISCVIPVHMHGHMSDMLRIRAMCSNQGIPVIEDASQAHLGQRDGVKVGEYSDITIFSLYPTKNLGALGDAGVAVTNDESLMRRIRTLANYGSNLSSKYEHDYLGYNRRLDAIQAAILLANLPFLVEWTEIREAHARRYREVCEDLDIPFIKGHNGSVWHHFCVLSNRRDELRVFLEELGIGTEVHYPRLAAKEVQHFMRIKIEEFPQAAELTRTTLSLPISQFHTKEMIEVVVHALRLAKAKSLV